MIDFEVDGVFSKDRHRTTKAGHIYTTTKTRNAEALVAAAAVKAMGEGAVPMEGPLCLTVIAHMPIAKSWSKKRQVMANDGVLLPDKRPDLDNVVKLVSDACNGVCYRDDSQLCALNALKIYADRPRTEVRLRLMDGSHDFEIQGGC